MTLRTFSAFYYGHEVSEDNNLIDFNEGSGALIGEIDVGTYSLTEYALAVKSALDAAGGYTYTVTVDRITRNLTISATGTFNLLTHTGASAGSSAWSMMGFAVVADTGFASSHTGTLGSGYAYYNQFILQDHIGSDQWTGSVDSSVNRLATGKVEVVSFGEESFMQGSIKFITNRTQSVPGGVILHNSTGVFDALQFLRYAITKGPIEFMGDRNDPGSFETFILESTEDSKTGTSFKLKEMYDRGLPGWYDTGILKFRVYIP